MSISSFFLHTDASPSVPPREPRFRRFGASLAFVFSASPTPFCGSTGDPPTTPPVQAADIAAPLPRAPVDAGHGRATVDASADAASEAAAGDASACASRVDFQSIVPAVHVPIGTEIVYTSNPPSNGPHYPVWANFQEYSAPVPDPYLVHSMEHGAVVLFYKCSGPCEDVVSVLRAVRDGTPTDPLCDPDIRVRVIIVPRPTLEGDDEVAAAAWGTTYRAPCADPASLSAFVQAHYGQGPEDFCAAGITTF